MAYSMDLRLKVLAALDRGKSQASVARRFETCDCEHRSKSAKPCPVFELRAADGRWLHDMDGGRSRPYLILVLWCMAQCAGSSTSVALALAQWMLARSPWRMTGKPHISRR